jgi:hypothetical protein
MLFVVTARLDSWKVILLETTKKERVIIGNYKERKGGNCNLIIFSQLHGVMEKSSLIRGFLVPEPVC